MIYLDNSATSFYKPKEVDDVINDYKSFSANPGRGAYKVSQQLGLKIFETREKIKEFFGVPEYDCVFSSGCSHSLNLAILGTKRPNGHIITTYLEHNSVLRPLEFLKRNYNIEYTVLEKFDKTSFENALRPNTYMVITTQVSNVIGEHIDIEKVGEFCRAHKLIYLVDSAQGAGHIFDNYSNADLIAFAGHKGLLGLCGGGGLLIKNGVKLSPIDFGGTGTMSDSLIQPDVMVEGFEVGTLPTLNILSIGGGIDFINRNKYLIISNERNLQNYFKNKLKNLYFIKFLSNLYDCNGVYSFNVGYLDSAFVADILNERFDICVRSGLHCAPLVHKHFNTLNGGAVRVSLNYKNNFEDIDKLEHALKYIYSKYGGD